MPDDIENALPSDPQTLLLLEEPTEAKQIDDLPSVADFPEKAKVIVEDWISKIRHARIQGQDELDLVLDAIQSELFIDSITEASHLWACRELISVTTDELVDDHGEVISAVDFSRRGRLYAAITQRKSWNEVEQRMCDGSLFVHSTPIEGLEEILRQNAIASRANQTHSRFNTGEQKPTDRELYDVSFAWDTHTGQYGDIAFVVPAEAALQDSVFCEVDGIHVLDENPQQGYTYSLEQPYVVIVPDEVRVGDDYYPLEISYRLKMLGWSDDQIREWKIQHLVVVSRRDERTNRNMNNGKKTMMHDSWDLSENSPLRDEIKKRLTVQQNQEVQPAKGRFYPSGIKFDLGDGKERWLYEYKQLQ